MKTSKQVQCAKTIGNMSPNAFKPKVAWTNTLRITKLKVQASMSKLAVAQRAHARNKVAPQCHNTRVRFNVCNKRRRQVIKSWCNKSDLHCKLTICGQVAGRNFCWTASAKARTRAKACQSEWFRNGWFAAVKIKGHLCFYVSYQEQVWLGTIHQHHVQVLENCAYCGFWKSSLRRQSLPSQHQFASQPECSAGFGLRAHTVTTPASHHSSQDTDQCLRFSKSFATARTACA